MDARPAETVYARARTCRCLPTPLPVAPDGGCLKCGRPLALDLGALAREGLEREGWALLTAAISRTREAMRAEGCFDHLYDETGAPTAEALEAARRGVLLAPPQASGAPA